jgi:hypothetical protein
MKRILLADDHSAINPLSLDTPTTGTHRARIPEKMELKNNAKLRQKLV